jgi:hypothetical protein
MIKLRSLLGFLVMSMLVAFALPARADNKSFFVTLSTTALNAGTQQFDVTFNNNANGNSTFNSIEFDVRSGGAAFTGAWLSASASVHGSVTASSVVFTNLSPVKPGGSVKITVSVSTTCSAGAITWSAAAWTGSVSKPSNPFTLAPLPPTSTVSGSNCKLSFKYAPAGAQQNVTITSAPSNPQGTPVGVQMLLNGIPDPTFTGPVTLAIGNNPTGATLANAAASSASGGVVSFPSISIDKVGTGYTLHAVSGPYTVDSAPFSIFGGTLGCSDYDTSNGNQDLTLDPNPDMSYSTTDGSSAWGLQRGPNFDGSDCIKVDYSFGIANGLASFIWDKATGQQATFKYGIVWPAESVDPATGWPSESQHPRVSWGIDNPNPDPGSTDFVPAMLCKSDDLTKPQADVLPVIPDQAPFNTNPNPQFQPGQLAKVCITQQGFTSGVDGSGNVIVQFWTKVVDEADSWLTQR